MLWIQHSWNVWARKGQTRFAVPKTQLYPINSCRSNSTTEPASYSFLTRPVSQPKIIWTGLNQRCTLYTTSIHPLTKNRHLKKMFTWSWFTLFLRSWINTKLFSFSLRGGNNISGRIKCFWKIKFQKGKWKATLMCLQKIPNTKGEKTIFWFNRENFRIQLSYFTIVRLIWSRINNLSCPCSHSFGIFLAAICREGLGLTAT